MAVGVEDREESGPWKYYKVSTSVDLESLREFVKSVNRVFKNLSK